MYRTQTQSQNQSGDDLDQILKLWALFSPEAQTMSQLRQAQTAQIQSSLATAQVGNAYAQAQGFPSPEIMLGQQQRQDRQDAQQVVMDDRRDARDARAQESQLYHDQVDQAKTRDSIALLSGLVETPEEKASLAQASTRGKAGLDDFAGQVKASRSGAATVKGFSGLLDPNARVATMAGMQDKDWETLWRYAPPGIWAQLAPMYPGAKR